MKIYVVYYLKLRNLYLWRKKKKKKKKKYLYQDTPLPGGMNCTFTYLFIRWTLEEVLEGVHYVLGKPCSKNIFVRSKLMTRLSHHRVYHIQPWHLVFWLTLKKSDNLYKAEKKKKKKKIPVFQISTEKKKKKYI